MTMLTVIKVLLIIIILLNINSDTNKKLLKLLFINQ